jgi:hypothetical protein
MFVFKLSSGNLIILHRIKKIEALMDKLEMVNGRKSLI